MKPTKNTNVFRRKSQILLLTGALVLLPTQYAHADAVVVTNFQGVIAAINGVSSAVTAGAMSVVQAILSSSTQAQANSERQNAINKTLTEAAQNYDKQYKMQEHAARIEREYGSSDPNSATQGAACEQIAIGENIAVAEQEKRDRVKDIAEDHVALNTSTEDPMMQARKSLKAHVEYFCSDIDKERGRCKAVAQPEFQNADLKASNFLTPNETMTYGDKESLAARTYLDSLVGTTPAVTLKKDQEATPAGRAYLAEQFNQQRKIDIAAQSLREIYASREEEPGLGTKVNMPVADVSVLGVIKHNASKFLDPEWHNNNGSSGTTELLREQSRLLAFKTWMDFKSYEKLERMEAMLAVQSIEQIKASDQGRLLQLRQRALQMNSTK